MISLLRHMTVWPLIGCVVVASGLPLAAQSVPMPGPVTAEAVRKSLDENAPTWSAKITALGRPCLLLNQTTLAEWKKRAMVSPRPAEIQALLAAAYDLAPKVPRTYVSPEEFAKKGEPIFSALGEEWVRIAGDEITLLTVAAALDPSPLLRKALHDAVIATCKYPTWGRGGGALREDNMDLACAHMARGVALAWDWLPELWTAEDRDLITKTVAARAGQLLAGLYGKGFWARGYSDNHNHVNCTALGWCGVAFYSDIPQAPEWLAAARIDFQNVASVYPEDGSSAEGVPYWAYGMSFILQYIEGTRLVIDSGDLYQVSFLKNAAAYRLNGSTSGLAAVLPWGDTFAKREDGYCRPLISRLAVENKDSAAAWLSHQFPRPTASDTLVWMALWPCEKGQMPALPLDYHHWVADIVETRSGWGPGDYLLSIKSGFTNRNHSHLDAGALALAFDSEWLLTAPGYGKGKTSGDYWDFQKKRWDFFSTATESHCTLLINGRNQRFDSAARATVDQFLSTPLRSWTGVNLVEAYHDVAAIRREVMHARSDYILVFDSVIAKPGAAPAAAPTATVEWLAQLPTDPAMQDNSMTVKAESGQLRLEMLSPAGAFTVRKPTAPNVDVPGQFSTVGIHTYAVKNSGEKIKFIALLQPGFSKAPLPALKTTVTESKTGAAQITVAGANWTDRIYKSDTTETVTDSGLKSTALTTVIRSDAKGIQSCLAVQASVVELPGITIKLTAPANIGLQQIPNGSWILDADQDIATQVVTKGFSLQPLESKPKAFRYLLAKDGTAPKQATEWLASLVLFREKAPIAVRALATQPPLPATTVIAIEAESFAQQGLGRAEVVDGKPGARGKSLRSVGNASPDHVIDWSFDIAQSGQYQLIIRYATKLSDITAAMLIDGTAPHAELVKASFPATGGWSIQEDNWKDLVLTDKAGKPLVFNLAAGKHELRLAKPSGALALDQFEFRGIGKQ